jgi:hypothetical protein
VGALGPEVALGTPSNGYVGYVMLTPRRAPAGATVLVHASGLPPRQAFDLLWATVKGDWKARDGYYEGREYRPVAYRIAPPMTDDGGRLDAAFIVPEDFGFEHDVVLQQGRRVFTKASLDLAMTVEVSPQHGPPGTLINVDVKGIGWRQMENSWLLLYDNRFTGWMSAVTTAGSAHFTIPAAGIPGVHVLEILHGDFTFPYRNMQQSPEPGRPQFVRTFTVTDGAPVLPPPAQQQGLVQPRIATGAGDVVTMPSFSVVGQPVRIEARDVMPGKSYEVTWQTVSGNRVGGGGWEERIRVLARGVADRSGVLSLSVATPDDLGGAHAIGIQEASTGHLEAERAGGSPTRGRRTATHWILPSAMPLEIGRGPTGTTFRIHLKGVGWTETANIYALVYDNAYIGYGCGFNSQGDVEFILHASGSPGWHFIDVYPSIYKGSETRPVNFRLPQLTYARDHPGEDLPRFRFAFEVTEGGP